jgi:hypothetical protein
LKSPEFVPVIEIPEMVIVEPPVLVRTMLCAGLVVLAIWLENVRLAGLRLTAGPDVAPIPTKLVTLLAGSVYVKLFPVKVAALCAARFRLAEVT